MQGTPDVDLGGSNVGRAARIAGLLIILIGLIGAGVLWWLSTRTEPAWVTVQDVERYDEITADDVKQVDVPKHRADEMQVLSVSPAGSWAAVAIPQGSLVTPGMTQDTPPERRVIGDIMLPEGWRGYGVNLSTALAGELRPGDLVDLMVYQMTERDGQSVPQKAQMLFQKLPLLKIKGGEEGVHAVLAVRPEQAVVLDGQLAQGMRPLLLLTQEENPDLPPLQTFDTQPDPAHFGPVAPLPDDATLPEGPTEGGGGAATETPVPSETTPTPGEGGE
jgi:hypothetical protein